MKNQYDFVVTENPREGEVPCHTTKTRENRLMEDGSQTQ